MRAYLLHFEGLVEADGEDGRPLLGPDVLAQETDAEVDCPVTWQPGARAADLAPEDQNTEIVRQ